MEVFASHGSLPLTVAQFVINTDRTWWQSLFFRRWTAEQLEEALQEQERFEVFWATRLTAEGKIRELRLKPRAIST